MSFPTRVDEIDDWYAPSFRTSFDKELAMNEVYSRVQRFLTSEDGPTAVEYAVMLGLIIVALVGIVGKLATAVSGTFSTVSSTLGSS
jgi:pilus assembly protein Flp/PilA